MPDLPKLPLDTFNYVLGTQAIGGSYQFTKQPALVESAQVIRAMGSNQIKFKLADDPSDSVKPKSLLEIARDARSVRTVLDMPFAHYLLWAYPVSTESNRFRSDSLASEYREMYGLTRHLLTTYRGTGKTFYLGNWEGDWHLLHLDPAYVPKDDEVQDMIHWVNMRQKAVDDAKRDTPHTGATVYHYLEVNRVVDAMQGKVRMASHVLPSTNVDFVSYSSYDSLTGNISDNLKRAFDYLESKLAAKPSISGKRVFIGEYGFPSEAHTPDEQDHLSRQVMRACLTWGCLFCLYWELFNNEVKDGKQVGFWLIDDQNRKQPIYLTHQIFYAKARKFATEFQKAQKRILTRAEFSRAAQAWL